MPKYYWREQKFLSKFSFAIEPSQACSLGGLFFYIECRRVKICMNLFGGTDV